VLITSRDDVAAAAAVTSSSRSSRLVQLSAPEGRDFVKKRLQEHFRDTIDDNFATEFAKQFGLYPLYMDQVMSFIQSASPTLDDFLKLLESEPADHELQDWESNGLWYTTSVAKAIDAHLTTFGTSEPQARAALSIIAFLDPDSIPQQLLLSTDGKVPNLSTHFNQQITLGLLSRPSFIYFDSSDPKLGKRIHLHRLVRDAALRSDVALQSAFDAAVSLLRQSFPLHGISRDHMVENWAECEVYQPHVLALHQQYLEFRQKGAIYPTFEFIELAYSCAWYAPSFAFCALSISLGKLIKPPHRYLCERGRFVLSKKAISTIHEDYTSLLVSNAAVPREFLADIYTVQLYYHNESDHGISLVDLATQAINIREDAVEKGLMKPSHPNRANGLMNLGVVLALEDPRAAIGFHSRALEIRHMSDEYRSVQIHGFALNYLNIGRCWWVLGDLENAALCFEQCLALWKEREIKLGKKFSLWVHHLTLSMPGSTKLTWQDVVGNVGIGYCSGRSRPIR
jgi:tetratricopeptide (TPR) repeat protein